MPKRRRQYIVDRSFQLKYTVLIALLGGLISALFAAWMWQAHTSVTELLVIDEALKEEVAASDQGILLLYVGITLLMVAALGLVGVLITHRVAGPAFVMQRYLGMLEEGAYPTLRPLRRKDELKGFFDAFERAVEALRGRDRAEAESLDDIIRKLGEAGAPAEAIEGLKAIRDRKLEAVAGAIKASDDEPEEGRLKATG